MQLIDRPQQIAAFHAALVRGKENLEEAGRLLVELVDFDAWQDCAQTHKAPHAAYQKETAADAAAVSAEYEAAANAKEQRRSAIRDRNADIQAALDEKFKESPGRDYAGAFALVKVERPELFDGMLTPAANTAKASGNDARQIAFDAALAEKRKVIKDPVACFDAVVREHPELCENFGKTTNG